MRQLILVRSGQMRAHAPIVARDDDTAAASGVGAVNKVLGADTSFSVFGAEVVRILVCANASDVDYGVGGKAVLQVREGTSQ